MESLRTKRLYYSGSLYPICSIVRLRKFIERGWTISAGQILKMAYQVSKLDLDDVEVLKEQVCGVDSLYFIELVDKIQNIKGEGNDINQEKLNELIDEIFE